MRLYSKELMIILRSTHTKWELNVVRTRLKNYILLRIIYYKARLLLTVGGFDNIIDLSYVLQYGAIVTKTM